MTISTTSSLNHKSPQLFSKAGVFLLHIGLIGLFLTSQLVGLYLAAPYILNNKTLSTFERLSLGGLDGTVTSFSMIFTFVIISISILLILNIQLSRLVRNASSSINRRAEIDSLVETPVENSIHQSYKSHSHQSPRSQTEQNDQSTKLLNLIRTSYVTPSEYKVAKLKLKFIGHYLGVKTFSFKTAIVVICMWILFVVVTELSTYVFDLNPSQFIDVLYSSADPKWLFIVAVVILAPIYEELIFRGILWSAIVEQFEGYKGFWMASIITSALFAVIHTQYDVYEMSVIFILALLLSFARAKSGSILLPIIIHILNNGLAMWMYVQL